MTPILYILLIAVTIILIVGQFKNAEIIVGLIKGFEYYTMSKNMMTIQ